MIHSPFLISCCIVVFFSLVSRVDCLQQPSVSLHSTPLYPGNAQVTWGSSTSSIYTADPAGIIARFNPVNGQLLQSQAAPILDSSSFLPCSASSGSVDTIASPHQFVTVSPDLSQIQTFPTNLQYADEPTNCATSGQYYLLGSIFKNKTSFILFDSTKIIKSFSFTAAKTSENIAFSLSFFNSKFQVVLLSGCAFQSDCLRYDLEFETSGSVTTVKETDLTPFSISSALVVQSESDALFVVGESSISTLAPFGTSQTGNPITYYGVWNLCSYTTSNTFVCFATLPDSKIVRQMVFDSTSKSWQSSIIYSIDLPTNINESLYPAVISGEAFAMYSYSGLQAPILVDPKNSLYHILPTSINFDNIWVTNQTLYTTSFGCPTDIYQLYPTFQKLSTISCSTPLQFVGFVNNETVAFLKGSTINSYSSKTGSLVSSIPSMSSELFGKLIHGPKGYLAIGGNCKFFIWSKFGSQYDTHKLSGCFNKQVIPAAFSPENSLWFFIWDLDSIVGFGIFDGSIRFWNLEGSYFYSSGLDSSLSYIPDKLVVSVGATGCLAQYDSNTGEFIKTLSVVHSPLFQTNSSSGFSSSTGGSCVAYTFANNSISSFSLLDPLKAIFTVEIPHKSFYYNEESIQIFSLSNSTGIAIIPYVGGACQFPSCNGSPSSPPPALIYILSGNITTGGHCPVVPTSPKNPKNSEKPPTHVALIVSLVLFGVVVIAGAVYYFKFYQPKSLENEYIPL